LLSSASLLVTTLLFFNFNKEIALSVSGTLQGGILIHVPELHRIIWAGFLSEFVMIAFLEFLSKRKAVSGKQH